MSRDTLVTDGIKSKGGGSVTLGALTTLTDAGSIIMGAGQGIAISDGGISGDQLIIANIAGVDARIGLTGRGTSLDNFGTIRTRRINIPYTAFAVANTTAFVDYSIDEFVSLTPDNPWVVTTAFARLITQFVGTSITALEMTCGDASSAVGYIPAGQIDLTDATPALWGDAAADRGGYLSTYGTCKVQADQLTNKFRVTLTTTGGGLLNALSAGEVSLYVNFYTLPTL